LEPGAFSSLSAGFIFRIVADSVTKRGIVKVNLLLDLVHAAAPTLASNDNRSQQRHGDPLRAPKVVPDSRIASHDVWSLGGLLALE
jgi:hypothetical protein